MAAELVGGGMSRNSLAEGKEENSRIQSLSKQTVEAE